MSNTRYFEEKYKTISDRENFRNKNIKNYTNLYQFSMFIAILCFISLLILIIFYPKSPFELTVNDLHLWVIVFYFLSLFIALFSVNRRRHFSSGIPISHDEIIFLRFYELYKIAIRVGEAPVGIMRNDIKKQLINDFGEVVALVEDYNFGNISLSKTLVGDEIENFKYIVTNYLYSNVILGEVSDLTIICNIILDICRYMLNPSLDGLKMINHRISDRLSKKEYSKKGITERIKTITYERPTLSRMVFTVFIALIIGASASILKLDKAYIFTTSIGSLAFSLRFYDIIFKDEEKYDVTLLEEDEQEISTQLSIDYDQPQLDEYISLINNVNKQPISESEVMNKILRPLYNDIDIIVRDINELYWHNFEVWDFIGLNERYLWSMYKNEILKSKIVEFYTIMMKRNDELGSYKEKINKIINYNVMNLLDDLKMKYEDDPNIVLLEVGVNIIFKNQRRGTGHSLLHQDVLLKSIAKSVELDPNIESASVTNAYLKLADGGLYEPTGAEMRQLWDSIEEDVSRDESIVFLRDSFTEVIVLGSEILQLIRDL